MRTFTPTCLTDFKSREVGSSGAKVLMGGSYRLTE